MFEAQLPDGENGTNDTSKPQEQLHDPQQTIKKEKSAVPIVAAIVALLSMVITGVHTCIYWETTHVENRAYVVLKGFDPVTGIAAGDSVQIRATFTNVGRTPAYDVSSFNEMAVDTIEEFNEYYRTSLDSGNTIGPNMEFPIFSHYLPISRPLYDGIQSGKWKLLFCVTITYRDVFKKPHRIAIYTRYDIERKRFAGTRKHDYAD